MHAVFSVLASIAAWQGAAPAPCTEGERETIIALIEALGGPCRYRVESHEMSIPWSDAALSTSEGRMLAEAAASGANGSFAMRWDELAAARDAVVRDFCSRTASMGWRRLDVTVADLGAEKLQSTAGALNLQTAGQYRCPAYNLTYENYFGERHMLRAHPPGNSPMMLDLESVLNPLLVGEGVAEPLRRAQWDTLECPYPDVLSLRVQDEGEVASFLQFEVSRDTLLPIAVSWHRPSSEEGARLSTLLRYAPIAAVGERGQGQLFVSELLAFGRDLDVFRVEHARISEVTFDVDRGDLELHVADGTMFFDERSGDASYLGMAPQAWPSGLVSQVVIHPEIPSPNIEVAARQIAHLRDHAGDGADESGDEPSAPGHLARSLPWIGGVLIAAGVLGLLGGYRRRTGSKS